MSDTSRTSAPAEADAPSLPRIIVYSSLFPNRLQPQAGLFVRERTFRVAPPTRLVVVSPQPWFPLQSLIRRWRPSYRPPAPVREEQQGVEVWFPRFLSLPGVLRRLDGLSMALCTWPLVRRLRRAQPACVLDAHFAYPCGYAATLLGRWLRLPVSITLRGTELRHLGLPALRRRVLQAVAGASKVFSVSDSLRRALAEHGADAARIHVVGNGVDLNKFQRLDRAAARAALGVAADAKVLVSVGGLVERKGFHRVIEQLPALLSTQPKLHYLIVGGPSPEGDIGERLRAQVRVLGLEARVTFTGPLPPDQLSTPLSAADVFVLATANEGWANVFLEAMACGLPVVTTDVGGNREVVNAQHLGRVVPFGDGAALQATMAEALSCDWDRDAIVEYARSNQWSRRVEVLRRHFAEMGAMARAMHRPR